MPERFVYLVNLVENGYKFPAFESEAHERYIYNHMTGQLLLLEASGIEVPTKGCEVIDSLLARASEDWVKFQELMSAHV